MKVLVVKGRGKQDGMRRCGLSGGERGDFIGEGIWGYTDRRLSAYVWSYRYGGFLAIEMY
jgi:hypothetical protein